MVTILAPDESPLYKMISKVGKAKGIKMMKAVEYRWVEDDLQPLFADQARISLEGPKKRICPKFILCGHAKCPYYSVHTILADKVMCYKAYESISSEEILACLIELVDVEEIYDGKEDIL